MVHPTPVFISVIGSKFKQCGMVIQLALEHLPEYNQRMNIDYFVRRHQFKLLVISKTDEVFHE
jgi:hypothetical protein